MSNDTICQSQIALTPNHSEPVQQGTASPLNVEVREESVIHNSAGMMPHNLDGFIPPLTGERFDVLKRSLLTEGQRMAILIDENGMCWDGRSRLRALQELRIPVRVIRVSSTEGKQVALSGLKHREMTVVEEAQFVTWVARNELAMSGPLVPKFVEKKTREKVGQWLRENLGWMRRSGDTTIQKYLTVASRMNRASPDQLKKVAEATSVHAAISVFAKKSKHRADQTTVIQRLRGLDRALDSLVDQGLKLELTSFADSVKTMLTKYGPSPAPETKTATTKGPRKGKRRSIAESSEGTPRESGPATEAHPVTAVAVVQAGEAVPFGTVNLN